MRPSASWAIDAEPIRARGIIAKYNCALPIFRDVILIARPKNETGM